MADDHTQRPYRASETPARGTSGASPGTSSGNDPLAELARLIGQNDPFAEFGRDNARRTAAPRQPDPAPDWPPQHEPQASAQPAPPLFGSPDFARQPFGSPPLAADADLYQVEGQQCAGYEAPAYGVPGYDVPGYPAADAGYEQEPFPPNDATLGHGEDDYYDDRPTDRRRIGILAIAGVFALAVIGTAGAFGYRALFGSSSVPTPPPVIKAEATPSKIVPASAGKDVQSSKMITDRVNERGQGEKLVSREEEPVAIGQKPANIVFPPGQGGASASAAPQLGSGVVGSEPKRIRTIAIHPDQPGNPAPAAAIPEPVPPPAAQAPQPRITNITPRQTAPTPPSQPRNVAPQRATAESEPAPRPAATRAAPQPSNAPLSLNPNATAAQPARPAPAPQRTASAPTSLSPSATAATGGYAVQVSSQRSEADAQAAFRSLQGKFPSQLGGRQPLIKRVDLGAKGIYYRAMVGPFGSSSEASELCSSLKSAGGSCLIQRN